MLSKEGRCKIFFDRVDGFVVSEGVGIFFLKKLIVVEWDGDYIYGVIKGSVVNYGGCVNFLMIFNLKV